MKPRQHLKSNNIQAYVLGLLSVEEAEEMDIMLSLHPQLQQKVNEYRHLLYSSGDNGPVPPAHTTWEQIEAIIRRLPGNNVEPEITFSQKVKAASGGRLLRVRENTAAIFIQRKWVTRLLLYMAVALLLLSGILLLQHHYTQKIQRIKALQEQIHQSQ
ncbi:hypothetical protein [Deminuibacter soli]|uniref:Uncharacterized protein n=1 Tax=Deminuibacter soli TaxID=2291815 RepID=A0A3E1NEG3_9BACT|nr:hypothetical protein [Deminuibacter soli]RFM26242.1 hypothetical protein DXN05_20225 [Deminuibacter soli]